MFISNKIEARLFSVQTVHWQISQAIDILKILLSVTKGNLLTDHLATAPKHKIQVFSLPSLHK